MKAIKFFILSLFALIFCSCAGTTTMPNGAIVQFGQPQMGPPQQGPPAGYYSQQPMSVPAPGYQGQGHRSSYRSETRVESGPQNGGRTRQWYVEETQQDWLTPETQGVHLTVNGDTSNEICRSAGLATLEWCKKMWRQHGVWPTREEATARAQIEFKTLGVNLVPTNQEGASGGFKIVEYKLDGVKKGKREKNGAPRVMPRKDIAESDVPDSILKRSRSAGRDTTEPFSGGDKTIRYLGPDTSSPSFEKWKKGNGQ